MTQRTRILVPTDPDWDPTSRDSMVEDLTLADAVQVLEWVLRDYPADHRAAPAVVGALWTLRAAHAGPARAIVQQMLMHLAFDELQKATPTEAQVATIGVPMTRESKRPKSVQSQALELALEEYLTEFWEAHPTAKAKILVVHEEDAPDEDRWLVAARDGKQEVFRDRDEADRVARRWAREQGGNGLTTEELAERDAGPRSIWSVGIMRPFGVGGPPKPDPDLPLRKERKADRSGSSAS